MEYTDLEGGGPKRSYNVRRNWHKIPRLVRFYLIVAVIFVMTVFFSYDYVFRPTVRPIRSATARPEADASHVFVRPPDLSSSVPVLNKPPQVKVDDEIIDNRPLVKGILKVPLTAQDFKDASARQSDIQREIQGAIKHSWSGYRAYAWGYDHLKPISKGGHNWFKIGLTILDSLDTLLIAGLSREYEEGMQWIRDDLTFEVNQEVNCFETTIRALAGLLSAFHLTQDRLLLDKAEDLGSRLVHCFDSPSKKVPFSDVNLKSRAAKGPAWSMDSSLSEVSSMQIEFRDLAYETKKEEYETRSFATSKHLHELVQLRGDPLLSMFINPVTGNLSPGTITMGARADSYYEYLLKQYLQAGTDFLLTDYLDAVAKIRERLVGTTNGDLKLVYVGEIQRFQHSGEIFPKMDHLVCFLSGTLALGYHHYHRGSLGKELVYRGARILTDNETFAGHLKLAEDLARTCNSMYNLTATGLSPEIGYFGQTNGEAEFTIRPNDAHNLLRPEFVESLFFLYHITGNQIYRDWGYLIFQAFQKHTRISSGGYTTIGDVRNPAKTKPRDMMESFWLAETLKYLYLLFLDDKRIVDALLNDYVFNTEGHLLPRRVGVA